MAITQAAGMEIGGPVASIADVRTFIAACEEYGVTDDTILDGYLEYRVAGIPAPAAGGASIMFVEAPQ
jgi:hypothetical protein